MVQVIVAVTRPNISSIEGPREWRTFPQCLQFIGVVWFAVRAYGIGWLYFVTLILPAELVEYRPRKKWHGIVACILRRLLEPSVCVLACCWLFASVAIPTVALLLVPTCESDLGIVGTAAAGQVILILELASFYIFVTMVSSSLHSSLLLPKSDRLLLKSIT